MKPVNLAQASEYLERADGELVALRRALQEDTELAEMARSPLMLNVMTLAYRGVRGEVLAGLDRVESRSRISG